MRRRRTERPKLKCMCVDTTQNGLFITAGDFSRNQYRFPWTIARTSSTAPIVELLRVYTNIKPLGRLLSTDPFLASPTNTCRLQRSRLIDRR